MKTYTEQTGRKYRPTIDHPVGKFCLKFMDDCEYLLEKGEDEPWLTSGFPMLEEKVIRGGKEITRPETKVQYYDSLGSASHRLNTMNLDWRDAYTIVEITEEGFKKHE